MLGDMLKVAVQKEVDLETLPSQHASVESAEGTSTNDCVALLVHNVQVNETSASLAIEVCWIPVAEPPALSAFLPTSRPPDQPPGPHDGWIGLYCPPRIVRRVADAEGPMEGFGTRR